MRVGPVIPGRRGDTKGPEAPIFLLLLFAGSGDPALLLLLLVLMAPAGPIV
jgi:hypothetical protein